ncbi:MAG: C-5 sterol desaturase [Sphingobacteriales bacterium 50-39]|nr:sterol desaturase family protein [Sphingobacteriales bacterium]OJW55341.1 MAG: C-5 sterol desaturase [Sphingobacteriales bacterium 50-39]
MPPNILYYAIPGFVILLSLEAWFSYREGRHLYETKDTFSSLALGLGNVATGLITKALIFGLFTLLYRWRLFTLDGSRWWHWVLAFFADDFSYYWFHRASHHINWFWASHVVHHSSRRYNLAAALRQTWTGNLTGAFLFWCWMPIVGFHPIIVLMMQSISLIYQFWIHTETINRLPAPLEFVLNTPSHHRVHHGIDLPYLDRNHGGVLIIWDRIFGTFTPEQGRPEYGLTRDIGTFNPFIVALKTWGELIKKAVHSGSLKNALLYFIKPPGWSHDGSTRTTQQLIEEHNRQHPEQPITHSRTL